MLKQKLMPLQPPLPQCDVPPPRPSARPSAQQSCHVFRVVGGKRTTVKQSADKVTPLGVRICTEERIESKIKPE